MNLKNKMILEEYRQAKNDYTELGDIVSEKIKTAVQQAGIMVLSVEHRVKSEESLSGKLDAKEGKYQQLSDITDILGIRVICYFSDSVDIISKCVESIFDVDYENSVDKRAQLDPNAFGYLSVHYVCSLQKNEDYSVNLKEKKFEIQIRTILQHTWAEIEHDLGYKSEFGVPRAIRREFSRIAGLLEIADEQFMNIRDGIKGYGDDIRRKIANDQADKVLIDLVSLKEYVAHNVQMRSFLQRLADICGAEISEITPESYLEQLSFLGIKTLGDLSKMLEQNEQLAYSLAEKVLKFSELDILSSNIGLRYLCRAKLVNDHYSEQQVIEFLMISLNNKKRAEQQAKALFEN